MIISYYRKTNQSVEILQTFNWCWLGRLVKFIVNIFQENFKIFFFFCIQKSETFKEFLIASTFTVCYSSVEFLCISVMKI